MPARVLRSAALAGLVLLPLVLLAPAAPAEGEAPERDALVREGLAYLAALQGEDSFGNAAPAYVVELLAQVGVDPAAWPSAERSAFSMLGPASGSDEKRYKAHARIVHATATSGLDPRDVNGHDLLAAVRAGFVGSQAYVNDDMWTILALRAAGVGAEDPQVRQAALELEAGRAADGGWGFSPKATRSDPDMTGMAIAALAAAGGDVRSDARARAYLDSTYDAVSGGHRGASGINAQSTVWALHAYGLMGAPVREASIQFLHEARNPDGGFALREGGASDAFATAEVLLYLSGARHPLPAYAPGTVSLPRPHALDPAPLRVDGPFTRATWNLGGATLEGTSVVAALPSKGAHAFSLLAEGPGARWRTGGTAEALTARPVLALPTSESDALRRQEIAIDAAGARDPDGAVARVEVDWGDGASESGAPGVLRHAYALPGTFVARLRAVDDEGAWSDAATVTVRVANRAPAFGALPQRLVADRVSPLALDARASDPDGDAVRVAWRVANASGEGNVSARLATLGEHVLALVASDPHGGAAFRNLTVEVVNRPPRLANLTLPARVEENGTFIFAVEAGDDDGPAPGVAWRFGNETIAGTTGTLALPAGTHVVNVTATDADGATRSLVAPLVVAARADPGANDPGAPPAPAPVAPRLAHVSVELEGRALRVRFDASPPEAEAWLLLDGRAPARVRPGDLVPLGDASEVVGALEARVGGLVASAPVGPLRVEPPPPAPLAFRDAPASAAAGQRLLLRLAPHDAPEFRFEFGDGNATAWGPAPEASHAYARPGAYEVRAQARAGERVVEARHVVRVDAPALLLPAAPAEPAEAAAEEAPVEAAREAPAAEAAEALREATPERRPAPAPGALLLVGALALAAALGTRAPSGPPPPRRRPR